MSSLKSNKRLLDEVRDFMRLKHYSIHTERTYCDWIKRFVHFHVMSSRDDLKNGEQKIEAFLTYLAVKKNIAPATQNQAMNALVFLYKKVLKIPLKKEINAVRARKKKNIPVVMTRDEVRTILDIMDGVPRIIAKLLYGCGLRIMETIRLRVQDIDYKMKTVTVRSGKGQRTGLPLFPEPLPLFWKTICLKYRSFIPRIFPRDLEKFIFPMPLKENIPMQTWNGTGSMCFLPGIFQRIH